MQQQYGRRAKECVKACQAREHDLVVGCDCAGARVEEEAQ